MKTLFKATMKPRRRLQFHVEQTKLIKRTNKITTNSSYTERERQAAKDGQLAKSR